MEILLSPNKSHTITFWKGVNLIDDNSLHWEESINIFKNRIEGRFF
jgi:hypothetical protein